MIIEVKNLCKQFGKKMILDKVILKINKGEFVSIIGPSGSGKSTLLNILSLISKQNSGDYNFLDKNNFEIFSNYNQLISFRSKIGIMSELSQLVPDLSVKDNILLPLYINGFASKGNEKFEELVNFAKINDLLEKKPISLSSGERQRILLCRALVLNPEVLIADEPTSNLDEINAIKLVEHLADLNDKNKTTIIMATHDHKVYKKTKIVYELNNGKINWNASYSY